MTDFEIFKKNANKYYSQFAPLGEVSCEFFRTKFVKLSDICERYESSNADNEEESNEN